MFIHVCVYAYIYIYMYVCVCAYGYVMLVGFEISGSTWLCIDDSDHAAFCFVLLPWMAAVILALHSSCDGLPKSNMASHPQALQRQYA